MKNTLVITYISIWILFFTSGIYSEEMKFDLSSAVKLGLKKNRSVLLSVKDSWLQAEISHLQTKAQYKPQLNLTGNIKRASSYDVSSAITSYTEEGAEPSDATTSVSGDSDNIGLALTQQFPILQTGGKLSLNCNYLYETQSDYPNTSRLGMEFTQPLSPGQVLTQKSEWKDAEESYFTAELNYKSSQEQLIYDIINQYIGLVKAEKAIERIRKSTDAGKSLLDIAKLRHQAGEIAEIDMLNLDIQNKLDEDTIITQERALAQQRDEFVKLLGLTKGTTIMLDPEISIKTYEVSYKDALELSKKNRAEYKQQILGIDDALVNLKQTKYSNWPDMSLNANYYLEQLNTGWTPQWEVNAEFTLPLYAGGIYKHNVRKAESSYNLVRQSFEEFEETVERELDEIFSQLEINKRRIEVLKQALKASEESLKVSELRFKMGIISYNDYSQDMERYNQAEQTVTDTELEIVMLHVRLLKSVGKLLEVYSN